MRRALGKFGATTATVIALVASLVVLAPAARAATPRYDCAAPSQSDCTAFFGPLFNTVQDRYTNTTNATLGATTATYFKCAAAICTEVATSPTNTAEVNNTSDVVSSANADTTQTVNLTQHGNTNTANVTLSSCQSTVADCSASGLLTTNNSLQKLRQRVTTVMDGTTPGSNAQNNNLTINVSGNQRDNTQPLTANFGVSGEQEGLQYFNNTMRAAVNNTSSYNISKNQSQLVNGLNPMLKQDVTKSPGDGGPGQFGRTEINLTAPSLGTNAHTLRTSDVKLQNSTVVIGAATMLMGYAPTDTVNRSDADGLRANLLVDSGVARSGNAPDIDFGAPGSSVGAIQSWTQMGNATQHQLDDLPKIPFIGSHSPKNVIFNSVNHLAAGEGAQQSANGSFFGEADNSIAGKFHANLDAGSKHKVVDVPFNFTRGGAEYTCEQNTDNCPGGTVVQLPMTVRNVSTGESYTGDTAPQATNADAGQTVEYRGIVKNLGDGATGAMTLTTSVPAGTTLVAGSCGGCTQSGNTLTWNLGAVAAHTNVTKTFQVTINSGKLASNTITNGMTAHDSQNTISSNDTTVNVLQPSSTVSAQVRNVDAGGTFASSASANTGQTVEYRGTDANTGGGSSTGTVLTSSVPASTTYVAGSCGDCTKSGNTLTWNLGQVAPGSVSKTFRVTVNSDTPPNTVIHNSFTRTDDQEASATSNDAPVTVSVWTVKVKIYPANSGGSAGNTPVAMLSQANDNNANTLDDALQLDPSTVCFARTVATAQSKSVQAVQNNAPCGSVQTTSDVSGDGLRDLKMAFNTIASGVLPTDSQACVFGLTYSKQSVQGCGPTK